MIFFWITESLKSVKRAKSSFFLTLISLTLAVILIQASLIAFQLSRIFNDRLKSNINLSVFIQEPFTESDLENYNTLLKEKGYVKSVRLVSKEDAAEAFIRETGEDFRELLDYNPLPASFVVNLNTDFISKDSLTTVIEEISSFNWVDEVIFKDSFVYRLLSYIESGKNFLFGATAMLIFIAIYLVYSTIKLITNNRLRELETMKLVGAKLSTIKMPIILNGIFTGLLSGLITLSIYYLLSIQATQYQLVKNFILTYKLYYIISILAIGPLLSFIVTVFALRKVSLKI